MKIEWINQSINDEIIGWMNSRLCLIVILINRSRVYFVANVYNILMKIFVGRLWDF